MSSYWYSIAPADPTIAADYVFYTYFELHADTTG